MKRNLVVHFTAAVLRQSGCDFSFESVQLKEIREDEVLVRLVATGVCHTDVSARDSIFRKLPLPLILGHEGAGIIERVGAGVTTLAPGDHVILTFGSCGQCASCHCDEPAYCHNFGAMNSSGRRRDGSTALTVGEEELGAHFFGQSSFAAYSVANVRNAIKIRQDAPLELLGPLGCGVQTGVGAVLNVLAAQPRSVLAVLGGGGVGLSAVMAAVVAGCRKIVLSEPNSERRALALELGATDVIDPATCGSLSEALLAAAGTELDNVLDTSGIPAVIEEGMAALGPRGSIGLVAMHNPSASIVTPLVTLLNGGKTVRGIIEGGSEPHSFIPRLVDLFMEKRLPVDRIVRFYPFEGLNQALEDQRSGAVIKPVIRFPGS